MDVEYLFFEVLDWVVDGDFMNMILDRINKKIVQSDLS